MIKCVVEECTEKEATRAAADENLEKGVAMPDCMCDVSAQQSQLELSSNTLDGLYKQEEECCTKCHQKM